MNIPPRPDLPPPSPEPSGEGGSDRLLRASWKWYVAIGIYLLGTLVAGFFIAFGSESELASDEGFFIVAFVGQLVPTGVLIFWLQMRHRDWARAMGLVGARLRDILYGVVSGVIIYLAGAFGIAIVLSVLYALFTGRELVTPDQIPVELSGVRILLAILMAVVLAPLVEEFFFRGLLFRGMRASTRFWPSALGSAAFFGFAHYSLEPDVDAFGRLFLVIMMFFVGAAFAWIYERRGSLWVPVVAHMTFNTIGLSLIAAAG